MQEHHDYTVDETDIDKVKAYAKEKEQSGDEMAEWVAKETGGKETNEVYDQEMAKFKKQNKPLQNTAHNEKNDIIGPKNQFR